VADKNGGADRSRLKGFLKPFGGTGSRNVSPRNKVVDSYVYGMDKRVSPENHVVKSRIDPSED